MPNQIRFLRFTDSYPEGDRHTVLPGNPNLPHRYLSKPMLTAIIPKLPMRNKRITKDFYLTQLGFQEVGQTDFADYLMVQKDTIELHFFAFNTLDPAENYGQVYIRTDAIDQLYQSLLDHRVRIHQAGHLQIKPWGQKEFSVLDPDHNLLTFGQRV